MNLSNICRSVSDSVSDVCCRFPSGLFFWDLFSFLFDALFGILFWILFQILFTDLSGFPLKKKFSLYRFIGYIYTTI
jgi:hypothetical protein